MVLFYANPNLAYYHSGNRDLQYLVLCQVKGSGKFPKGLITFSASGYPMLRPGRWLHHPHFQKLRMEPACPVSAGTAGWRRSLLSSRFFI